MTKQEERLEAIRQELARQDSTWQQVMAAVARMGDDLIAVPGDVLEQLAQPAPQGSGETFVVGLRG